MKRSYSIEFVMPRFILLVLSTFMFLGCASQPTIPDDCDVRYEGNCYASSGPACEAAGCPDNCTILRTEPGQVSCGEPAAVPKAKPTATVLFVLTGHTQLGDSGKPTGYFLGEVAHPWHELNKEGFAVEFASPLGGAVVMDPKSNNLEDPVNKAFLAHPGIADALANTIAADAIDPTRYQGIYYAGGHGAMWDFPDNAALAQAGASVYEGGGFVAAVCHGPAALVNIKLADGTYLVAGKKVAAFTNAEEAAVKLTETVPFLLATRLEERGAVHQPAADFQEQVMVDQRLITGQNPASATGAGKAMIQALRK